MAIRKILTIYVWAVSLLFMTVAGLIAAIAMLIAQTYDPSELIIEQTIEPWTDALIACVAFAAILIWSAIGLRLWHTARYRAAGLVLAAAEACCVTWTCVWLYNDYL